MRRIKISRHPIRAGKEHSGLAGILKIKNSAVFQKATDNANDTDILAQAGHFRPQATDAADDQIDGHIRARSFIQFLDDLLIDERVQFRNDASRFACSGVVTLALNQSDETAVHIKRRDHQFFQSWITGQASERIEDDCHFLRQFRFAGEQTKVGVNARGARVIVASAEVHVAPELVCIAANDQQRLAMRFEADHSIDDVRAGFLQTPGPLNIARLIKARAQLNNGRNLFPGIGCIDERFDNGRITARSVQRDFDRQHLWITRSGLDQFDNLIEAVVRMMKQHVLASQDLEKIDVRWKRRIARRLKWPVLSAWQTHRLSRAA